MDTTDLLLADRLGDDMPRTATRAADLELNIDAFCRALQAANKSPGTIASYRMATDQLRAFLEAQGMPLAVRNVKREHVEAFLVARQQQGLAPATVAQRFRSLQQFWRYLEDEGEVRTSPMAKMKPPAVPDNPPTIVTAEQMRAMLRTCDGTTFTDRRDTALLSLFYDSGVRRAEMAGMQLADLDQQTRTVAVTGKGNRVRVIRYGRETSRVIDRYLRRRAEHRDTEVDALWLGKNGALSVYGVEQVIQRRAEEAGLTGIHCHSFRHAATHHLLQSGYSEGDAMQQMGWRSRQMVDRYARSVAAERARTNYDPHSPMDKLRKG
jgi:site-specific recombinase XerD